MNLDSIKARKKQRQHPTFYRTVISSPQWKAWEEEQRIRLHEFNKRENPYHFSKLKGIYDMPEVMGCGWISQEHFQDFIKFVTEGY